MNTFTTTGTSTGEYSQMKIHYLQHVPFENLAGIEQWAKPKGCALSATRFHLNDPLPNIDDFDWLVIMGGPMNIYEDDKYPWLVREKSFIEEAIKNNKVILGICLGAQLIADVLGAKVVRNLYTEIGWFPIELLNEAKQTDLFNFLPKQLTAFHWHGDTFELPQGAIRVARSEGCRNQGFIYQERVIGLQFHLESTRKSVQALIENCKDELVQGKYIQTPDAMLSKEENFSSSNSAIFGILDRMLRKENEGL